MELNVGMRIRNEKNPDTDVIILGGINHTEQGVYFRGIYHRWKYTMPVGNVEQMFIPKEEYTLWREIDIRGETIRNGHPEKWSSAQMWTEIIRLVKEVGRLKEENKKIMPLLERASALIGYTYKGDERDQWQADLEKLRGGA